VDRSLFVVADCISGLSRQQCVSLVALVGVCVRGWVTCYRWLAGLAVASQSRMKFLARVRARRRCTKSLLAARRARRTSSSHCLSSGRVRFEIVEGFRNRVWSGLERAAEPSLSSSVACMRSRSSCLSLSGVMSECSISFRCSHMLNCRSQSWVIRLESQGRPLLRCFLDSKWSSIHDSKDSSTRPKRKDHHPILSWRVMITLIEAGPKMGFLGVSFLHSSSLCKMAHCRYEGV
jgi:hypothetical protein